jgi:hypothetical protein
MITPRAIMNSTTMKLRTYLLVDLFILASFNSVAQNFQKTDYGVKSII